MTYTPTGNPAGRHVGGRPETVTAPDARLVRRRWIPLYTIEWVEAADKIMIEHGAVQGTIVHKYESARWKAKKLIRLMVELELHERWELSEHIEQRGDGWLWSVVYYPGRENR